MEPPTTKAPRHHAGGKTASARARRAVRGTFGRTLAGRESSRTKERERQEPRDGEEAGAPGRVSGADKPQGGSPFDLSSGPAEAAGFAGSCVARPRGPPGRQSSRRSQATRSHAGVWEHLVERACLIPGHQRGRGASRSWVLRGRGFEPAAAMLAITCTGKSFPPSGDRSTADSTSGATQWTEGCRRSAARMEHHPGAETRPGRRQLRRRPAGLSLRLRGRRSVPGTVANRAAPVERCGRARQSSRPRK
jgi:hypothetical protein